MGDTQDLLDFEETVAEDYIIIIGIESIQSGIDTPYTPYMLHLNIPMEPSMKLRKIPKRQKEAVITDKF